ncbi:MAG TPA: uracil-DNA glycosylase [Rubricoccaceae bacterium]|jgi:DNA polymerase|nr:uracil-DNA glycosylase [Rubricoccaceae bacterium]
MASRKAQLEALHAQIRVCTLCPLCASRTHAVPGDGRPGARALLVGEGPGEDEDASGHPFVGSAGRYLDHVLAKVGLDRADLFITNVVKCRPPKNRKPKPAEARTCVSTYLDRQIALVRPKVVFLLGATAAKYVLEGYTSLEAARGKTIRRGDLRYLVTYHPASRFYREELGALIEADFARLKRVLARL